jgi:SAM-dependent methyltransferase
VSEPDQARRQELLEKEGRFWDLQEERIDELYARPHDWRFVPDLAQRIVAPRMNMVERLVAAHRGEIRTLLDIGCGNGWFCRGAAARGIRSIGVDLSEKKIETAKALAAEQGVAELCEFHAVDVLQWRPKERVDLLSSHGSLHHFPEFETALQHMVREFLRPGGLMLFVEPNHEGMPPEIAKFLMDWAKHPRWQKWLDVEFYLQVTGQKDVATPAAEEPANEMNLRLESPAGKEFFGEHIDLDRWFRSHYELLEARYFQYDVGHLTNAFFVFQKSRLVRAAWRAALPLLVWRDDRRAQLPERRRWAEEGLWFLRGPKSGA